MIDKIFVCHHRPLVQRKIELQKFFEQNDIEVEWVESYLPDEIEHEYKRVVGSLNDSEISLYLKHEYCFKSQVENNIENILILEDDVNLPNNFLNYLERCMKEFTQHTPKLDGLMLGSCCNMHPKNITDDKYVYYEDSNKTRCTHAMIFNLDASRNIIMNLKVINYPIDHKLNWIIKERNLKIGWVEPSIKQKSEDGTFKSSILHTQVSSV